MKSLLRKPRKGVALPILWLLFASGWAAQGLQQPTSEFRKLAVLDAGKDPHQIAFSLDGKTAYVAAAGSDWIAVIDVASLKVTARYEAKGVPLGVQPLPDGQSLAFTRFRSNSVARLQLPGLEVSQKVETGVGSSLLVPLPEGRYLVSTEQADRLWVLDGKSFSLERYYPTGKRPFPPSATSDGRKAFVPGYDDGTVTIIDLQAGRVLQTLQVGQHPSGGTMLLNDSVYAVAIRGENRLTFIYTANHQNFGSLREGIGESPFSIVATPNQRLAFVNNTASHDISVIDMARRQVSQRLEVGEIPIVMAVHPSGNSLWVSSEGSDEVTVFEIPGFWRMSAAQGEEIMKQRCRQEVTELHQFFEDWAMGRVENSDQSFQRFAGVLADDFQIIGPTAILSERDPLLSGMRRNYGPYKGRKLRIWIEDCQCRPVGKGLWLATYQEWHEDDKERKGRLSSALFREKPSNPNGLEWVHVHEVWLPAEQE